MKKQMIALGAAALLLAPIGSSADAQPWDGPGQGRGGQWGAHQRMKQGKARHRMMGARMAERLGLTDEQRSQMRELQQAQRKQQIRLRADLKIARMELRELVRKSDSPKAGISARVAAVNTLQARMLEQRVDFQLKRKAVLTDDQRKKLEAMQLNPAEGHRGGRGGWMRKGRPGGGGGAQE